MKPMDLFDELTYVDEAFILEAHETPAARQTHFRFRRFGALLAAVIAVVAMSVAVVATMTEELNIRLWQYYTETGHSASFERNGDVAIERDSFIMEGDENRILVERQSTYTVEEAQSHIVCDGRSLQVMMEAMVLMDDGQVKYTFRTKQGNGEVNIHLNNVVSGTEGTLANVRITVSVLYENEWTQLYQVNRYLPMHLGFQIPVGTDVRFPDMRYIYDGRATQEETTPPTMSADTEAEAIVPEGSNVVVIIEEPNE